MADYSYTVTANGDSSAYLWSGHGLANSGNPILYFRSGDSVVIENISGGHVLQITNDTIGTATESNGLIEITGLPQGVYTYVCTSHSAMTGQFFVGAAYAGQGPEDGYGTGPLPAEQTQVSTDQIRIKINEIINKGGVGGEGGNIIVSSEIPDGAEGDLWFNETLGLLFVYIDAVGWIEASYGSTAGFTPGRFWSSGWVRGDGSSFVENGTSLYFNHGLNSQDVNIDIYAATDEIGTNSQRVSGFYSSYDGASNNLLGADVSGIGFDGFNVQLGINGYLEGHTQFPNMTPATWNDKYIKIVVSVGGSGGGGASVSTGTEAPEDPAEGDLWFNENVGSLFVYIEGAGWVETNPGGGGGALVLENFDVSLPRNSHYSQGEISSGALYNGHNSVEICKFETGNEYFDVDLSIYSPGGELTASAYNIRHSVRKYGDTDTVIIDGYLVASPTYPSTNPSNYPDDNNYKILTNYWKSSSSEARLYFADDTLVFWYYNPNSTEGLNIKGTVIERMSSGTGGSGGGGGDGASVSTGTEAPANPAEGDLWFDENVGSLFVYIDGTGWVETNPGGGGGGSNIFAYGKFDGTQANPSADNCFGVSSITKNGTGQYVINFDEAQPDTNYVFIGSINKDWGQENFYYGVTYNADSILTYCKREETETFYDNNDISFMILRSASTALTGGGYLAESPELEFTATTEYNATTNPLSVRNGPYPRWEHNLGQTPKYYSMSLRCKTAEEGWNPGDEFFVGYNGTYGRGEYAVYADSTYVGFIFKSGTTNNPFTIGKKEQSGNNPPNVTGNSFLPDPAKWRIVFRASTSLSGGGSGGGSGGEPRAYVAFDGSAADLTASITNSLNVTSITDGGTGRYYINLESTIDNPVVVASQGPRAGTTTGDSNMIVKNHTSSTATYSASTEIGGAIARINILVFHSGVSRDANPVSLLVH